MTMIVRKLWRGEYPLPIAFWGFYVGLSLLSLVAAALILMVSYRLNFSAYLALVVIRLILLIWTSVGVWRSAVDYVASPDQRNRILGYGARVVVVAWAARVVWINASPFIHHPSN
jgi:hypothetical protein